MTRSPRPRLLPLALVGLVACAPEPASSCYAPGPYTYAGTIRDAGRLPASSYDALALRDGRALAVTGELVDQSSTFAVRVFAIDPAAAQIDEVATWTGGLTVMTPLVDGRILFFDRLECAYVLLDLAAPATAARRTCDHEPLAIEYVWQDPDGEVLLFGRDYGDDDQAGEVFSLDLADAVVTRVDTSTEHGFRSPPRAPFPLCDGRIVFPHTFFDGGDFFGDAEAVHYYDPAARRLTTLDLPFAPGRAAQLDARTALLLGPGTDDEPVAYVLDLDTQALRPVSPPEVPLLPAVFDDGNLVGTADGKALTVVADGAILLYEPDSERFVAQDLRFTGEIRRMLRLSTGPLLAFSGDGGLELYE